MSRMTKHPTGADRFGRIHAVRFSELLRSVVPRTIGFVSDWARMSCAVSNEGGVIGRESMAFLDMPDARLKHAASAFDGRGRLLFLLGP